MPVLDNHGHIIADDFVSLIEGDALPASGSVILPLARLLADPSVLQTSCRIGVLLPAGAGLDPILPLLDRLTLIALSFRLFRDGRGFTLARELREHFHYAGDIRATGHVLPDQYVFLVRCGVSSVALPEGADPAVWRASLHRQSHPEQPAAERALPLLRRLAMPFDA